MDPIIRRIVAVAAHLGRTGQCPIWIHSLGAGDSAQIHPTPDGFVDLSSGLEAKRGSSRVYVSGLAEPIDLNLDDGVEFIGYDPNSGERFSGRAGGGATVTIYDARSDFFQYAVAMR